MSKCLECIFYDNKINRQCTAYNNECEPDEDATHCPEFVFCREELKEEEEKNE